MRQPAASKLLMLNEIILHFILLLRGFVKVKYKVKKNAICLKQFPFSTEYLEEYPICDFLHAR